MTVEETRQENRAQDPFGKSSPRTGWTRDAIARLYFHSQMPAFSRRFRDRYHLNVSKTAGWPKVSLKKRTEPAARILYYHRVNDDNDPFFPAISTKLFEEEMRFVSEHYRVVSVAELLNVLAGGSTEPVLAITFDDGYQDNYHNAFPILQRYQLPASIFLTTGSLDSREPLWFEQLAEALKKTERESIELDFDSPRRFWMRTVTERLDSNGKIYDILRRLADPERKRWLDHILRSLGTVGDSERRDQMLTWDQIRFMKPRGIDFGGHTVTHPFISRLTPEQTAWEVAGCKRRIEEELQAPVDHFAYPSGREEDFGKWNKQAVRSAGYRAALTTIWGMNYQSTDTMELRRGGPWEETLAQFAYKLDWYQLVNG